MRKEINEAIQVKVPGCRPGDADYLKHYPGAWSQTIADLSEDKRQEFQLLARKWNEDGVSDALKAK